MKKKQLFSKFLIKLKDVIHYISFGMIFVVLAFMIFMPFMIKKTSFKGENIVIYNKTINTLSVDGKLNVKVFNTYLKTSINANEYNTYIKGFNRSSFIKNVMLLEIYLLFILLEVLFFYYIVLNISKLFFEKETDEYKLYILKNSFIVNVNSILLISLLRRFIYRNTMFSSLDLSMFILYAFVICMFLVISTYNKRNKVTISKRK